VLGPAVFLFQVGRSGIANIAEGFSPAERADQPKRLVQQLLRKG
jgi:hypothetical protein